MKKMDKGEFQGKIGELIADALAAGVDWQWMIGVLEEMKWGILDDFWHGDFIKKELIEKKERKEK